MELTVLMIGTLVPVCSLMQKIEKEHKIQLEIDHMVFEEKKVEAHIEEKRPDLIIVEVPCEFDVWSWMDEIYKTEKHIGILVISKEKNFDHAYQAIQHHALNFLLEPIAEDVFVSTLNEVYEQKLYMNEVQTDKRKLDIYELKHHQDMMEKILINMLDKPEELELLLGEVNHRYQTEIHNDNFQVFLLNTNRPEFYYINSNFFQSILPMIENAFPYAHEAIGAVIMPYGITGIINFAPEKKQLNIREDLRRLYEQVLELQKEFGEFEISMGVGSVVHTMKEINLSLEEAIRADQYKLVLKEKRMIFYSSDFNMEKRSLDEFISVSEKKNLSRYLRSLECDKVETWFRDIIAKTNRLFLSFPEGYLLLKDFVVSMAKEAWTEETSEKYFAAEEDSLSTLGQMFNGEQLLLSLKDILLRICQKLKESKVQLISEPIQIGVDYIGQHYHNAVTLEEIAKYCGLSPNYFSAMFKEQVGETYIDYLTGIRMEKAKQLLVTTKMTVKEIASEVGYLDDKYFRKLFKNRFAMTPSSYRTRNESGV